MCAIETDRRTIANGSVGHLTRVTDLPGSSLARRPFRGRVRGDGVVLGGSVN